MEKGAFVKDIAAGPRRVEGVFLVASAHKLAKKNGELFWGLALMDRTGSISAKIWPPKSLELGQIAPGALAQILARPALYQGALELHVDEFQPLGPGETAALDEEDFAPPSPVDPGRLWAELEDFRGRELGCGAWRGLVDSVMADPEISAAFRSCPAAKSMHQAYRGGLLEHSLNVARLCAAIADLNPRLDRGALLAGAILHDIGKTLEYSGAAAPEVTTTGSLLGHVALGLCMLEPFLERSGLPQGLKDHFRHLLVSHHGQLEYGSPRLPQTAEAFALHFADNLDAKLALCAALEDGLEAGAWSAQHRGLGRAIHKPERTRPQTGTGREILDESHAQSSYNDGGSIADAPSPKRAVMRQESLNLFASQEREGGR